MHSVSLPHIQWNRTGQPPTPDPRPWTRYLPDFSASPPPAPDLGSWRLLFAFLQSPTLIARLRGVEHVQWLLTLQSDSGQLEPTLGYLPGKGETSKHAADSVDHLHRWIRELYIGGGVLWGSTENPWPSFICAQFSFTQMRRLNQETPENIRSKSGYSSVSAYIIYDVPFAWTNWEQICPHLRAQE